jgi:hypothetical protein
MKLFMTDCFQRASSLQYLLFSDNSILADALLFVQLYS